MALRTTLGLMAVSALSLGCPDANGNYDAAPSAAAADPAPDARAAEPPALAPAAPAAVVAPARYEFLGGSFVTYNGELAPEVIEAASGRSPARPVFVWAGNDAAERPAKSKLGSLARPSGRSAGRPVKSKLGPLAGPCGRSAERPAKPKVGPLAGPSDRPAERPVKSRLGGASGRFAARPLSKPWGR
ncbi:MAG TPA: hypothetical protein VFS00_30500 [Polyangiaceae bacterium]|nr:hypothetical protein [Polyangiaceae bacterium]